MKQYRLLEKKPVKERSSIFLTVPKNEYVFLMIYLPKECTIKPVKEEECMVTAKIECKDRNTLLNYELTIRKKITGDITECII